MSLQGQGGACVRSPHDRSSAEVPNALRPPLTYCTEVRSLQLGVDLSKQERKHRQLWQRSWERAPGRLRRGSAGEQGARGGAVVARTRLRPRGDSPHSGDPPSTAVVSLAKSQIPTASISTSASPSPAARSRDSGGRAGWIVSPLNQIKFHPLQECSRGSSIRRRWELGVVTSPGWVRLFGLRVGFSDHP